MTNVSLSYLQNARTHLWTTVSELNHGPSRHLPQLPLQSTHSLDIAEKGELKLHPKRSERPFLISWASPHLVPYALILSHVRAQVPETKLF